MNPTDEEIAAGILELLPSDQTPVLNRVLLTKLRQSLEAAVLQTDYFDALDKLEEQQKIGRLRGAGGQIFLFGPTAPKSRPVAERELMAPTFAYLQQEFVGLLELPKNSASLVLDTSRMGSLKGTWARPDFILVTAAVYAVMPGKHVDVHSFELKSMSGGSVSAVHEALAQTRFTHYGHLVWHLPRGSRKENMIPAVLAQCDDHGIGFVRAYDPADPISGWEVLRNARRKPTHVGIIDSFLTERLTAAQRDHLLKSN